jgi:hypothetical protein
MRRDYLDLDRSAIAQSDEHSPLQQSDIPARALVIACSDSINSPQNLGALSVRSFTK